MSGASIAILLLCAVAILLTLATPGRVPQAVWPCAGGALLVLTGLLPAGDAAKAIGRGGDVYLFLTGMMLLSEVARLEGLFDWAAGHAVRRAGGSPRRLFALIYAIGIVVTVFLSNDATAVVMTPAVYAAARKAEVDPLPALFACALVANAASFVLPIANPANLVLYGRHMPALGRWLAAFALPSLAAIAVTYGMLGVVMRGRLEGDCAADAEIEPLTGGGRLALAGIGATALLLLLVSTLDGALGVPTCLAGIGTAAAVGVRRPRSVWPLVSGVSWGVLPLVAGLFVLVAGVAHTGLVAQATVALAQAAARAPGRTAAVTGGAVAILSNAINNLPAGLMAGSAVVAVHPPQVVTDALLIGTDLGPNLSVTGSLATILWLAALNREGEHVGFRRFLTVGVAVMPPALIAALAVRVGMG